VRLVGRIMGIAAGALFIVGMFLPYLDLSGPAQGEMTHTYWELFTRSDVIVFVVTIAAIDCLAIGFLVAPRPLAAVAAGLAGVALGLATPYDLEGLRTTFGIGGWLMMIGAFAMLVGAVLAASARERSANQHVSDARLSRDRPTGDAG
jgi:hypothetical protein